MKKYFLTGLLIMLPAAVSILCIAFMVNLLTRPFEGIFMKIFYDLGFAPFPSFLPFISKLMILLFLFTTILIVGYFAQLVIVQKFIVFFDWILHRLPLLNRVYRAAKEAMQTLFSTEMKSFSKVVLIAFPTNNSYVIGFLPTNIEENRRLVVFVPGTPNVLSGFLLNYLPHEIIDLPISVEEGLKVVLSCGNFAPAAFIDTLKKRILK